ncbi:MAG TPA: hypothetical protein VHW23_15540 [Kofleriaceae bacterium]|jgi:hypothetical protein|nr:hypothetical protein [Kofleriaceae bacterium]
MSPALPLQPLRGVARDVSPAEGLRFVCYCTGCRAFASSIALTCSTASAAIETKDVDIVRPIELRQAVAVTVATFRGDTLRFSQYGNVQRSWKELPSHRRADPADYRIVKEIRGSGRNLEIVTRRHGDDEMPGAHALHMIGVGAWLDHLIDKEPHHPCRRCGTALEPRRHPPADLSRWSAVSR